MVLKNEGFTSIIASLPTRKDSIPNKITVTDGCVELPKANLNCFVISKNKTVTECGKTFDFTTFLYGHQIDVYETKLMKEIYRNEGSDYTVWGKMKPNLFKELTDCFKNSSSVKNKYKKILSK
ncbi:MAG: hypothetical protein LBE36_12660 [Flavobacteriaceae bacterium]|nr:hypothetical protein [Flavobacteriaceae bacterium]